MSLANKYRPKTFNSVIGQSHIIDILQAKIAKNDNNHHNYIFYGPRGTGKTSTARLFAKAINATIKDADGNPSADDPVIQAIDKGTTLDYVEIDAASHTGVDNIREEILAKVPYPPTQLKKKVYVIDEVHMLSTGAFNALLKTIEEPKDYVVFILATTEIHKVPDTIISRCQVFNFKKVPDDELITHLADIAQKESIPYEEEALRLIASISDGCVRDAVKYLDQVSILGNIDTPHVSKFLGVASENRIREFLKTIQAGERESVFAQVDSLQETGVDLYNFAKQLLQYIDKHLMEDIDGYLAISQSCSEILSTIRYYPYPAIVYKIALNKLLNPTTDPAASEKKNETKGEPVKTPAPITQETPPVATQPEPTPVAQPTQPEPSPTTTPTVPASGDLTELKDKLINAIDKASLKANLADNIILQSMEGSTIHIVTISNIAHLMLQKQDTKQYIEKLLGELCEKPIMISVTFIKKEDFLQSMM